MRGAASDGLAVFDDADLTGFGKLRCFISASKALVLGSLIGMAECTVHATWGDQVWLDHGCEREIMCLSGTNPLLIRGLFSDSGAIRWLMDLRAGEREIRVCRDV